MTEACFRRKRRRRGRRCASPGSEHGRLHDIAWSECTDALHGDRWLSGARKLNKRVSQADSNTWRLGFVTDTQAYSHP